MTIGEWQQLTPDAAAREVHARLRSRLSGPQQKAAVAWVGTEEDLALHFAAAPRDADHLLAGTPFLAKDVFDAAGVPTLAGSTFLPEVRKAPHQDGSLVRALRHAGLVFAGKTHMHEFAYGITGENPHYGDCEHPRFPGRTTGGSSSGSASVVAAGIVPLAFGTDTGGSIRVPASFCGLYGIRLAPGDVWTRDAVPLAPSFDTAGWFTGNATDMRLSLAALVGLRSTHRPLHGCYVQPAGLDDDVAEACRRAGERFAARADEATQAELLDGFSGSLDSYNTLVAMEAWEVHKTWADSYRDRYDPVVWKRLNRGRELSPRQIESAGVTRGKLKLLWTKFFLTYDYLVLPATPCAAPTKMGCNDETRARLLSLSAPASLGGLPVLTIPIPLPAGLSAGLQLVVNQPQSPAIFSALARAEEDALGVAA